MAAAKKLASQAPDIKPEVALDLYRKMVVIRRFEEESARAYSQGKIGGFLHLYIGQEAIAVGSVFALRADDYMMTSYRDHGLALARGVSARACMAELFGKDTGCSRGLGGSMHMFDVSKHFYGGHAIVGGHIPLAAGMAFKSRYVDEDRVSVCFFGEGATNIAGFHEGLTLAALWKLPCIFVCENNEYAMGTPASKHLPVKEVSQRALAYGIPSKRIDGHDVFVVAETMREAAAHARQKKGPVFIEISTYRFRGHSMSDPGKYRTSEEVEDRKKNKDPVLFMRSAFLKKGIQEKALHEVEQSVEEEIADAVSFADQSPGASPQAMHEFIYAP